jgi:hypothetical protein
MTRSQRRRLRTPGDKQSSDAAGYASSALGQLVEGPRTLKRLTGRMARLQAEIQDCYRRPGVAAPTQRQEPGLHCHRPARKAAEHSAVLRVLVNGGSPLPPDVFAETSQRCPRSEEMSRRPRAG